MGVKLAQGELNAALRPIFAHIHNLYVIHDDVIIVAKIMVEHNVALKATMDTISNALNGSKCSFGKTQISFRGMVISSEGILPDPAKIEALDNLPPPPPRIRKN